jgi:hypothetical protein
MLVTIKPSYLRHIYAKVSHVSSSRSLQRRYLQTKSKNLNSLLNQPTYQPIDKTYAKKLKAKTSSAEVNLANSTGGSEKIVVTEELDGKKASTMNSASLTKKQQEMVSDINHLGKLLEDEKKPPFDLSEEITSIIMRTLMMNRWRNKSTIRLCTNFRVYYESVITQSASKQPHLNPLVVHELMEVLMLGGYHYEAMAWYKVLSEHSATESIRPTPATYEMLIPGFTNADSLDYLFYILADMRVKGLSLSRSMKDDLFSFYSGRHMSLWQHAIGIVKDQYKLDQGFGKRFRVDMSSKAILLDEDFIVDMEKCFQVLFAAGQLNEIQALWTSIQQAIHLSLNSSADFQAIMNVPPQLLRYFAMVAMSDDDDLHQLIIDQLHLLSAEIPSPICSKNATIIVDIISLLMTRKSKDTASCSYHRLSADLLAAVFAYVLKQNCLASARTIRSAMIASAHDQTFLRLIHPMPTVAASISPSIQEPLLVHKFLIESLSALCTIASAAAQTDESFMKRVAVFSKEILVHNDPQAMASNLFSIIDWKISYQDLIQDDISTSLPKQTAHSRLEEVIDTSFVDRLSDVLAKAGDVDGIVKLFQLHELKSKELSAHFYLNLFQLLALNNHSRIIFKVFDYYYHRIIQGKVSSSATSKTITKELSGKYPGLITTTATVMIDPAILKAVIDALVKQKDKSLLFNLLYHEFYDKHVMITSETFAYAIEAMVKLQMYQESVDLFFRWLDIDPASRAQSMTRNFLNGRSYATVIGLIMKCCARKFLGQEALSLLAFDARNRALKGSLGDIIMQNREDMMMFEHAIIALSTAANIQHLPRVLSMMEQGAKSMYSLVPNQRLLGIAFTASIIHHDNLVYEYLLITIKRYGFQVNHRMHEDMKHYAKDIFRCSDLDVQQLEARLSAAA